MKIMPIKVNIGTADPFEMNKLSVSDGETIFQEIPNKYLFTIK